MQPLLSQDLQKEVAIFQSPPWVTYLRGHDPTEDEGDPLQNLPLDVGNDAFQVRYFAAGVCGLLHLVVQLVVSLSRGRVNESTCRPELETIELSSVINPFLPTTGQFLTPKLIILIKCLIDVLFFKVLF